MSITLVRAASKPPRTWMSEGGRKWGEAKRKLSRAVVREALDPKKVATTGSVQF